MSDKDYLNPFYILPDPNDSATTLPYYTRGKNGKWISQADQFKKIHSPLLQAIDDDDVPMVQECLKRDNISPNQKYVIPQWEVPEADRFYLQPLVASGRF